MAGGSQGIGSAALTALDPQSAAGTRLLRAAERAARRLHGGRWQFRAADALSLTDTLDAEARTAAARVRAAQDSIEIP
jgi:hypothetical protein